MSNIFNIKKIKSSYTNIEYELETFDKSNNGSIMTIISHNSLERLMHNVLMNSTYAVKYDLNFIECTEKHTVVECVIWDNTSRRISGIGEATFKSLTSDIAKQYPSLTASQRAFDRAIIRYLGLEGKCYSDSEFPDTVTIENLPETIEVNEKEKNEDNVIETKTNKNNEFINRNNEEVKVSMEDVAESTAISIDESSETVTEEIKERKNVDDERFNVLVEIGRYKGKNKTIPEIYNGNEDDKKWFEWAVTSYSGKSVRNVINLMKEYKNMKEGKK